MRPIAGALMVVLGLGVTGTLSPLAAQSGLGAGARVAGWAPAPALAERVRSVVAERWGVEPAKVVLEWGAVREGLEPAAETGFELLGEGAGGRWVVAFEPSARREPALRVWLRAGVEVTEAVAARRLERDVVLEATDIATVTEVKWGAPAAMGPTVEVGWITQRQLRAGEPLRSPAVAPPLAVRTGESVRAIWRGPGLSLTLPARALGSAAVGEPVLVLTESGRRLEAIVRDTGLVEIETTAEVIS